jgi:protein HOOK3
LQALEEENASLVDRNAHLEDDLNRLAASKTLLESYKSQVKTLERDLSTCRQRAEALDVRLQQTESKLQVAEEERARDGEATELYEERLREMESTTTSPAKTKRTSATNGASSLTSSDSEGDAAGDASLAHSLSGTTMTELRLQVKRLTRELHDANKNKSDASRVIVLENLLKDANEAKARYETDFLSERRQVLQLKMALEDIRSGKADADGYVSSSTSIG